jgi:hypothetical protein
MLSKEGEWQSPPQIGPSRLLTGELFNERFEVLHQQIVQSNDADSVDYLTKALTSSVFN